MLNSKKITFLSRHYPPNPNINGESIWDMVKFIKEKYSIYSNILCINRSFLGGGSRREPEGNVIRLKTIYQGDNPLLRFFSFLYDGFILTKRAFKFSNSLIICTTSPPLLPFWATLKFKGKIKWALWAFDLFPEGFAVTGTVSEKNIIYQWVKKITYKRAPSFLITLGPKQAQYLCNKYKKEIPTLILPCGVLFYQDRSEENPSWWEEDKIFVGYCGNLNNAHNPEFVKAVIENIDYKQHRLILALYGVYAQEVKEYAKGKAGVYIVDNVPRNQLHFIDIHLVSLRKEWTHIAVPSKAVSAVCSGSAFLFCGSRESDNWYMLQKAGWHIDENYKISQQVNSFLKAINREEISKKKESASLLYKELKEMVTKVYSEISEFVK